MTERAQRIVAAGHLHRLVGQRLGVSRWETVDQARINLFADATGDHQWIHVDPVRATAGPFGAAIAHGYLILSLGPMLLWDILEVTEIAKVINYGVEKIRFPTPVPVDSEVRLAVDLVALSEVGDALHATFGLTFELKGAKKPACVGEILFRYYL